MPKAIRLKIVSDGTTEGSRVVDADTGDWLCATFVQWSLRAGELAHAIIHVEPAEIEFDGQFDVYRLKKAEPKA